MYIGKRQMHKNYNLWQNVMNQFRVKPRFIRAKERITITRKSKVFSWKIWNLSNLTEPWKLAKVSAGRGRKQGTQAENSSELSVSSKPGKLTRVAGI